MASTLSNIPEWISSPPSLPKRNMEPSRKLEYDVENYESYLVDSKGNAYEPYSMSWRYLGMYVDCDIEQEGGKDMDESNIYRKLTRRLFGTTRTNNSNSESRRLGSDSRDGGDDCSRKVLWAAYHDPKYRGNSIGEYQFYDHKEGTWDQSTCQTRRCAKMDCHASRSRFELIGVFKEADGLTDWAEQLFKHEGYCIWNGDKDDDESGSGSADGNDGGSDYEFMSTRQEYIPQGCYQMYLNDNDGNTVYRGITPLPGGNITESLYMDEECTQRSSMSFTDYIIKWYSYYYYDGDKGQEVAEQWVANTARWNELMIDYHVCQPCRAYNKVPMYEDEDRMRLRHLDENDGGGDEETWGYNCYDDAGYRNCNQCYKFETKTDMEPASAEDLVRASNQGTILAIQVNGITYGSGGIDWHDLEMEVQAAMWVVGTLAILGVVLLLVQCYKDSIINIWQRVQSRRFQKSLREAFMDDSTEAMNTDENSWSNETQDELVRNRMVIEEQRREIERMKLELDQENAIRGMEWGINHRQRIDSVMDGGTKEAYAPPIDGGTEDHGSKFQSSASSESEASKANTTNPTEPIEDIGETSHTENPIGNQHATVNDLPKENNAEDCAEVETSGLEGERELEGPKTEEESKEFDTNIKDPDGIEQEEGGVDQSIQGRNVAEIAPSGDT